MAQTIGNGGVRLEAALHARKVVDPDGRTVEEIEPEEADQVVSRQTARDLTVMMKNVVREGTGTAAALEGVEVAGKTGTAELNNERPQPAVVHGLHARGGDRRHARARSRAARAASTAAPIAKTVLEALGQ